MSRRLASLVLLLLVGCTTRDACPSGELTLPSHGTPAFVVVRTDYSSSALALLSADGTILDPDFVDSGSRVTSLVTSLSGDVVVPSTPLVAGTVAWLDRFADVLTIAPTVLPQLDVRGETTTHSGFSANPHDAILLAGSEILVARYGVNRDPSAPDLQRGDDLVLVDATGVTERVDVHADEALDLARCTGMYCTAFARPSVLLPLAAGAVHRVLVLLDRMTLDFHHAGTGAVVALDPDTLAVSAPTELDGVGNCAFAALDPHDGSRAYALCIGPRYAGDALATEDQRRAASGIVEITLDATGRLSETARWQPAASDPVPSNGLVPLGERRVLYVASGTLDSTAPVHDRLVDLTLGGAAPSIVYRASSAFVLQEGLPTAGGALVPDMAVSGILRLSIPSGGAVTVADTIRFDDCVGLPPVIIRPLAF